MGTRPDDRRRRGRWVGGVLAVVALLVTSGCATPGTRESAAEQTATGFLRALRDGDGSRACGALAPPAREELVSSAGVRCSRAVTELRPPAGGQARQVEVYGQQAVAEVRGDTLFLARFPAGWKVTGAECVPRGEQGYSCQLQGR